MPSGPRLPEALTAALSKLLQLATVWAFCLAAGRAGSPFILPVVMNSSQLAVLTKVCFVLMLSGFLVLYLFGSAFGFWLVGFPLDLAT